MKEHDVVSYPGKPDRVEESEYVEGTGNWYRGIWCSIFNLRFAIDK